MYSIGCQLLLKRLFDIDVQLPVRTEFDLIRLMIYLFQLVSSRVSCFQHPAVVMQFFETVVRYDKFFTAEPQYVPDVLVCIDIMPLLAYFILLNCCEFACAKAYYVVVILI